MPTTAGDPLNGPNSARGEYLLVRLRKICLDLPETSETVKWNNPTFVAGRKMFAVLDRYHGRWCVAFRAERPRAAALLKRSGFFPAPYSAKYGWICLDAEDELDWKELKGLLVDSYRTVALKRMLAAMK
jgi:predicted DNA-binding protein (MmcQ/YjbR family)